MQAYRIETFGIDHLKKVELPDPSPKPGEVVVRIHAVSLNYRDLLTVTGRYNPRMKLPRIPCSDGAGEVIAAGEGVRRVAVGDRVCGTFFQNWFDGRPTPERVKGALGGDLDGTLAELVVLREDGVVRFPDHLSWEEASTLPCAGLTAWNALSQAALFPGSTILIQGTGGVSLFALQFGLLAGARVLGTSSSDEKLARAKKLGLAAGANYQQSPAWEAWVKEQTGNQGVDLVVEVGGAGTFNKSLEAVRMGGTVAQIGVLDPAADSVNVRPILQKSIRVQGIYVGSRTMFDEMNRAIALHRMQPVVDRVYEFGDAQQAFRQMESGAHFGKIVIRVA